MREVCPPFLHTWRGIEKYVGWPLEMLNGEGIAISPRSLSEKIQVLVLPIAPPASGHRMDTGESVS